MIEEKYEINKEQVEKILKTLQELEFETLHLTTGNISHQRGNILNGIRYLINLFSAKTN
ncbi:MAG: hypothetical protein MJ211_14095 [Bacteroidales bacterium]|nr:hypothetical protein [Bacteroidales bacterium]